MNKTLLKPLTMKNHVALIETSGAVNSTWSTVIQSRTTSFTVYYIGQEFFKAQVRHFGKYSYLLLSPSNGTHDYEMRSLVHDMLGVQWLDQENTTARQHGQ